jgi:hypothetical protein
LETIVRIRSAFWLLALSSLPAAALAQRGVSLRGERAGDVGGRGFEMPRSSDLEDHTPVGIVLDKKKKLSLTDSQVTALKAVAKGLREKNADFYRMWDSVRVAMRSASGGAFGGRGGGRGTEQMTGTSPADREQLATARTRMIAIRNALREGDEWSRQETLRILSPEQITKAEAFWQEDAEEFGGGLPGGGGPGGGAGGGPPGGRRPPGA